MLALRKQASQLAAHFASKVFFGNAGIAAPCSREVVPGGWATGLRYTLHLLRTLNHSRRYSLDHRCLLRSKLESDDHAGS